MRLLSLLPPLLLAGMTAVLAAPAAAANEAPRGLAFRHHDWMVACDNTRTCRVAGYAADNEDSTASLLLVREGGPDAPVRGYATIEPQERQPVPGDALYLNLRQHDGGRLVASDELGTHVLGQAQVRALLDVLVRGGDVDLVDDETNLWSISTRGSAAVLLKMDEFQGRIGTPGAIMRKGGKPESSVPPALPKPVLQRAATLGEGADTRPHRDTSTLRVALLASMGEVDCPVLQGGTHEGEVTPLHFTRLDAGHVLVNATCWSGAYNTADAYWVVADKAPLAPVLVTDRSSGYHAGEIFASHKDRGLGDCWSTARWVWNGRRFALAYEGATGLCRGVPGGTWELPTHVSQTPGT